MQINKEEISIKGKPVSINSVRVGNQVVIVTGNFFRMAMIKEEWYKDVEDPESIIKALKDAESKPDIFTFWQRLPEIKPKYNYYMEWDSVAAIPVKSFNYWFEKQINPGARKAIRKAAKSGIFVTVVPFSDELVHGIVSIYNETPIRQGRPYMHYGKNFETVKEEISEVIDRCDFIGAYYGGELIGFIQLAHAGKYAIPFGMVSKLEHRDKSTQNALLAKAIEVCDKKSIPYLLYGGWTGGGLGDFKRHNGCEKIDLPRYYMPLTLRGKIILKLKLHRGLRGILPERLLLRLLDLRKRWYSLKYRDAKYQEVRQGDGRRSVSL